MSHGCEQEGQSGELRCLCGSLLARLVPEGVELKCRRCRQTRVVPLEGAAPLRGVVRREGPRRER